MPEALDRHDDDNDATAPADGTDEAKLAEIRDNFDYAATEKAKIIEEGDIDVRYTAGDTWDPADRELRKGRPILNLDQLSQYSNQLVNSYRQNPRAAKLSPAGDGATKETAELRANRIRQIEHDSHAQEVYTVGGENAATRGYGYARIVAEYEDATTNNQVLRLKAIPNPNQVLEDPDAESTSGRDWRFLFYVHSINLREFKRDYPGAKIKDFDATHIALAPRWFPKDGRIQIAEYWEALEVPPANGVGRPVRKVFQYLTNGVELLQKPGRPKRTAWKGSTIPFAACYGKIIYQTDTQGDSKKVLQSYIRLARDAAKSYNWTASTKLEALALPVKASLFAYEGQLDQTQVDLVDRSTQEPIPLITAKHTLEGLSPDTVLPLPQYGNRAPDISGYEIAGESYRRDVQNALGRYSVQDHRQGSTKVTSGVALRELDKSGDLGSYHFVAHYDDFVRELADKLNELLPFYDDAEKEIDTRLPDGATKRVLINKPTGRAPDGTAAFAPTDLRMDIGRHTVTISTGPSFDSQREQGKEAAMQLLGNEQAFPVIASDAVRLMDLGPIGDQMAKDLEMIQPPAMQAMRQQEQGKDGKPDPARLVQENAQLKQQLQHAEGVMQEMHGEIQTKRAELDSKEKIARLEIDSKERMAALDRETKISVAELGAKVERLELFLEERARVGAQAADVAAQASDQVHEHVQGELARTAAADLAAQAQAHQAGMAAAGAGAAADAQQAGHEQALEQGQQAAELAPAPTATA